MLAAARQLIDTAGGDFTMETLAERAGVAVGTLYRHYPTKTDLVAAVLDETIAVIADIAEDGAREVAAGNTPAGPVFVSVLVRIADCYASDAAVKHAAARLGLETDTKTLVSQPQGHAARATRAIHGLLTAAQGEGDIRADLSLTDLIMLVGSAPDATAGPALRQRYLAIMIDGIRRPGPREKPVS